MGNARLLVHSPHLGKNKKRKINIQKEPQVILFILSKLCSAAVLRKLFALSRSYQQFKGLKGNNHIVKKSIVHILKQTLSMLLPKSQDFLADVKYLTLKLITTKDN